MINLAVKGYLAITSDDGDFRLQRKSSFENWRRENRHCSACCLLRALIWSWTIRITVIPARRPKRALQSGYQNIHFRLNTAKIAPAVLPVCWRRPWLSRCCRRLRPGCGGAVRQRPDNRALYLPAAGAHGKGRLLLDELMGFKLYLEVAGRMISIAATS